MTFTKYHPKKSFANIFLVQKLENSLIKVECITFACHNFQAIEFFLPLSCLILLIFAFIFCIQFTTSSRRLDGGAYCGAPVGGKCMVSKAKLVLYAFAV